MAAARAFTARAVDSEKAGAARREIGDPGCPGLLLIVQPNGKKSWAYRGRHAVTKRPVKKTLGSYPAYSLADAREWAATHRSARERGVDLDDDRDAKVAEEARQRQLVEERQTKTLNWYWETLYDTRYVEPLRDRKETRRLFNSYLKPYVGDRSLFDIDHDDLAVVIEHVFNRAPSSSNRLLSMTKTMFKRAARELRSATGLKASPAEYLPRLHRQESRDRVLDDRELTYLLRALDHHHGNDHVSQHARLRRLILDLGLRITEAREASWQEIDLERGTWQIPGHRMKNHKPFLLLPSEKVVERLRTFKEGANSPWVFPSPLDPEKPFNGVSKGQQVIRAEVNAIAEADGHSMLRWSAHDLRRSFRTGLRALSHRERFHHVITGDVLEAMLHHISGASKGGIAGVYDRYEFADEKREGWQRWQEHVEKLAIKAAAENEFEKRELVSAIKEQELLEPLED